jgi:hypothetical protein
MGQAGPESIEAIELSDTAYPPNTSDAKRPHEDSAQLDYSITSTRVDPAARSAIAPQLCHRSFGVTTVRDGLRPFLDRLAGRGGVAVIDASGGELH